MFTALQQIEGHVVAPNVFGHALRINPLLVIFALLLGGQIYGFIGAFIALPIAAVLRETVVYLRRHLVLEPWPARAGGRARRASATRRAPAARSAARRWRPAPRAAARAGPSWAAPTRPPPRRRPGLATSARDRRRPDAPTRVSKAYGERATRCSASPSARAAASGSRSSAPTARARRRCCRSSPASLQPTRGTRLARPRRDRLGAAAAGALLEALGGREPAPVRAAGARRRRRRRPSTRMLEQTGLRDRAGDEVGTLSGGNRQRVNIAIGLLAEPAVLLLDEPSSSLDPRQRERLWEFVSGLADGGTAVVYATHNVAEAERYADRVLVLADGELLFSGTPGELERRRAATRRRPTSSPPSSASCTSAATERMRWLLLKDLQILRRSPLLVGAAGRLLGPGRRCSLGARAVVGAEQADRRLRQPRRPRRLARSRSAAQGRRLAVRRQAVREGRPDPRQDARGGDREGPLAARRWRRSSSRPTSREKLQGTLGLAGGGRPTVEVYYNAENPLKRQFVQYTINATLADANQALSGEVLREAREVPRRDRHGREGRAADRRRRRHPRPASARARSSRPTLATLPEGAPQRAGARAGLALRRARRRQPRHLEADPRVDQLARARQGDGDRRVEVVAQRVRGRGRRGRSR